MPLLPHSNRWSVLIAAQVALTLLLMATAGTVIRSFLQLMQMPLGYDPANVMKVGIMLHVHDPGEWSRIQSREARTAYIEQIREKIASVPGVSTVAVGTDATPPYAGTESSFNIDGTRDREQPQARVMLVDQRYFAALRIPLLGVASGIRMKASAETSSRSSITRSRRAISSSNTLGRHLRIPGLTPHNHYQVTSAQSTAPRQIIGVVGDARNDGIDRPAAALLALSALLACLLPARHAIAIPPCE